jgi:hypothetical protein
MRVSKRFAATGAVAIAVTFGAILAVMAERRPPPRRHGKYWRLSAVQVFEREQQGEIWVFAEVDGKVWTPNKLASPNAHTFATRHRVAVFGAEGLREAFEISSGPTFNQNCSCIFSHRNRLCLWMGRSLTRPDDFFVWNGQAFEDADSDERTELQELATPEVGNWGDVVSRLESASHRDGWRLLHADNVTWDFDVSSDRAALNVHVAEKPPSWKLVAQSTKPGKPWSVTIVETPEPPAQITKEEYEALLRAAR